MRYVMVGVMGVLLVGGQPAWAARTSVHDAAESQDYGRKLGGMLGRGVLNAVTCFVDVLVDTVNGTKSGPPLVGTLTGAAQGLGCGVLRLASGAVDVTTFWVPGFNGFPVSDSYDNCFSGMSMKAQAPAQPASRIAEQPSAAPSTGEMAANAEPAADAAQAAMTPPNAPAPVPHKRVWKK